MDAGSSAGTTPTTLAEFVEAAEAASQDPPYLFSAEGALAVGVNNAGHEYLVGTTPSSPTPPSLSLGLLEAELSSEIKFGGLASLPTFLPLRQVCRHAPSPTVYCSEAPRPFTPPVSTLPHQPSVLRRD